LAVVHDDHFTDEAAIGPQFRAEVDRESYRRRELLLRTVGCLQESRIMCVIGSVVRVAAADHGQCAPDPGFASDDEAERWDTGGTEVPSAGVQRWS